MNVNQLQSPPHPRLQTFSKDGSEKDADFLALKLLNRRSRLRLSPEPIQLESLPGKGRLLAIANARGWLAAATWNSDGFHALVLAPLTEIRSALTSNQSPDGPLTIQPKASIPFTATPHILAFTQDESRLLVAFTNGSLSVYDSQTVFQGSDSSLLHTFPSPTGRSVRDIHPSTGDPEIVAVLREPADGVTVEILDVQKMVPVGGWNSGGSPSTNPTSLSWSPKGKQIAIGLESGDVVTFSPTDTSAVKSIVPHPPSVAGQSVISITWLSNTEFHAIYAPAGPLSPDSEQTHFVLSLDSKAATAGDIKLTTPYLPFPGLRPPGSFAVTLRSWDPSRLLLFLADSTSSDIGLIGSLSNTPPSDPWYNFTLEEASTPSVPLDADLNETVLLGLDLDLTDTQPFSFTGPSGEASDVPPPPIMYLYASDGTLTGWYIIQTRGVAYPGMVTSSATPSTVSPGAAPALATPQTVFGTSPTDSAPTPAAFGSSSTTGNAPSSGGAFGFSAFSGMPSAFGGASFGFGSQQQPTLSAPALSTPTMSVEMTSAADDSMVPETESGFGGLSLGSGGGDSTPGPSSTTSMFGSFGATAQPPQSSTSVFAGGATQSATFSTFGAGPVKPATGFGALVSGPSAFGQTGFGAVAKPAFGQSSFGEAAKPAFGQSSFGEAAKPAFGQSSFGQSSVGQPAFGQSAFGKPAFGAPSFGSSATPVAPASTSAFGSGSGGFAAFASAGSTPFGSTAQRSTSDSKAVWATAAPSEQKPEETTASAGSAFGSTSGTSSAFSPAKSPETPAVSSAPSGGAFANLSQSNTQEGSVFGKTVFGQSSFGQSAFGQSAFSQTATPAAPKPATTSAFGGGNGGFAGFSSAGPSAFSAAAQQSSSKDADAKPVWATPSPFSQKGPSAPASTTTTPQQTPAFGQTGFGAATTTTTTPSTTTPAFGKTTAFGAPSFGTTGFFGKPNGGPSLAQSSTADSTSATPSTPSTPMSTAAAKGAFSAFSTSGSPFGLTTAASGSGKSFGDMLRQSGGDNAEDKKGETKPQGFSRTADEWKKPVSVFAQLKDAAGKVPEKATAAGDEDADGEEDEAADTSFRTQDDDSENGDDGIDEFLNSDEEDLPGEEEEEEQQEDEAQGEEQEEEQEEEEEEQEEEQEEEEDQTEAQEGAVPRTPPESPTVRPIVPSESPVFGVTFTPPSPLKDKKEDEPSKPIPTRASSTTPPGSPAERSSPSPAPQPPASSTARASSAPPSTVPASTPVGPGGLLGIGRPSTRPARSSPLTNRPISGDEDDEDEDEEPLYSPLEAKKARSASPAIPVPVAEVTSRPKTPPVLFGAPVAPPKVSPFTLTPSDAPAKTPSPVAGKPAEPAKSFTPFAGPGTPGGTSIFNAPPIFTPPTMPAGGLFGQKPIATPTPQSSLFGKKPIGEGGIFSLPPTPPQANLPSAVSTAPAVPPSTGGLFGALAQPPKLAMSTGLAAAPFSNAGSAPPLEPPHPAELLASPVQSMVAEFTNLYQTLNKELEDLKALAVEATSRTAQLAKPGGGAKTSEDLNQPTKWVMSDLVQFKLIMKEVERELEKWEKEKAASILHMRELESDMLKGSTRLEEIERFSKASKDTEFAKMLKQRTLNPDHLETQAQLRRDIRTIRGRLQQLEEYIQESKKKLNSVKNGKPSIKPPSLDTINRTYRNIDTAIEQEEEDIDALTARVTQLELSSNASSLLSFSASSRDRRLPDRIVGREVTPNIAVSTAAALNAERSAQKLKRALLNVRKEPLLNTKAIDAIPPEREHLMRKPLLADGSGAGIDAAFAAGLNAGFPPAFPASVSIPGTSTPALTPALAWSTPSGWTLPPFAAESTGASPLSGLGASRQRGARDKQHAKPIPLHQSGEKPPPPPPPAGFSWGPVPVIQPKKTISIFARTSDSEGKGTVKEEDSSGSGGLSGSWVADGFAISTPK